MKPAQESCDLSGGGILDQLEVLTGLFREGASADVHMGPRGSEAVGPEGLQSPEAWAEQLAEVHTDTTTVSGSRPVTRTLMSDWRCWFWSS